MGWPIYPFLLYYYTKRQSDVKRISFPQSKAFFFRLTKKNHFLSFPHKAFPKARTFTQEKHSLLSFTCHKNYSSKMAKIPIEICMISARGLRRSSSFWKLQWYAVGWINPDQKYCSKIDSSGSSNPKWKTKFSATLDDSHNDLHGLALTIEVYRREPIFLREKLHGTATVLLKEFLTKFSRNSSVSSPEVGSFQLRKKKTGKAKGFVDVSIWISEESEDGRPSYSGNVEGVFKLSDQKNETPLHMEDGSHPSYQDQQYPLPASQPGNRHYPRPAFPYANQAPLLGNYANPSTAGPSYRPSRTPPPPPPPSNVGFIPTFLPGSSELPPAHYINMPPNAAGAGTRHGVGPGFGMGVGAGALAAGAVIFGDDYMSGFDFPTVQGGSLTISADPPF